VPNTSIDERIMSGTVVANVTGAKIQGAGMPEFQSLDLG
jgi:hypothetical protein